MFMFLDEDSIYTFLDLALNLPTFSLQGAVRTPSYHRPFKRWFESEVHLDHFFARQAWGQIPQKIQVFPDELPEIRMGVHALQFLRKILLGVEVALSLVLFVHAPHSFIRQLILPVLATLLHVVKGVYRGCLRFWESHLLIIFLAPCRCFPGPLEEVQAGLLLDTVRLSP